MTGPSNGSSFQAVCLSQISNAAGSLNSATAAMSSTTLSSSWVGVCDAYSTTLFQVSHKAASPASESPAINAEIAGATRVFAAEEAGMEVSMACKMVGEGRGRFWTASIQTFSQSPKSVQGTSSTLRASLCPILTQLRWSKSKPSLSLILASPFQQWRRQTFVPLFLETLMPRQPQAFGSKAPAHQLGDGSRAIVAPM